MQNPNKFPHRCCTYYNEKGYLKYLLPDPKPRRCRPSRRKKNE